MENERKIKMNTTSILGTANNDFLVKTRTVFLYGDVNAEAAFTLGCQLKYLDYIDPHAPITLEINSPGGEVSSGLAIIDTMNFISAPVKVVVCGIAASMSALIAACGEKGMRGALPHSTIMIHQPLGGLGISQASDIDIYARNIVRTKKMLNDILADACGKDISEIENDTDRDYYLSAEEALEYGIIDFIVDPAKDR